MRTYDELMTYLRKGLDVENSELLGKAQKNVLKAIQMENQNKKQQKKDQKNQEGKKGKKGKKGEGGGQSDQKSEGPGGPKGPGERKGSPEEG